MLYGWAPATLLAFLMQLTVETGRRRPLVRVAYNSSVYALAAAAGGAAALAAARLPLDPMLTKTSAAAAAFFAVDLILVALIVAEANREPFVPLLRTNDWDDEPSARAHGLPERRPGRALGPLTVSHRGALRPAFFAYDLYQRSQLRALESMHTAVTDPVTGLGNRRRFDERINDEVPPSKPGSPLSVCLLDIDGLKRINDSYGHPRGDPVHSRRSARGSLRAARRSGSGAMSSRCSCRGSNRNRPACSSSSCSLTSCWRTATTSPSTSRAGIAAYPRDGKTPRRLVARADQALYFSKRHAPGSVSAHSTEGLGMHAFAADSPAD